jgi:Uma2 family endonuclease
MATLTIEPPAALRPRRETVAGRRFRFAPDEYQRLGEAGILTEDDRVELIDGEIVEMSPIGGPHLTALQDLTHLLVPLVRPDVRVSAQNPIRLPGDSEPQPDISLVRRARYLVPARVADVFLVIEVADSLLSNDHTIKLPLYAAAGIPEAWIFDLHGQEIERHTEPSPDGYGMVVRAGRGERLTSTVLPTVTLSIDDVLAPDE